MRQSIQARQQLREQIQQDITQRTQAHQARIRALRVGAANVAAARAPAPARPLVLLAHGDSWFDYPLTGNGLPAVDTDIVAQLLTMGARNPLILNMSHFGDATTDEMSLPKQQRLIEALTDKDNWLDQGLPDAILFSGGGNDVAGNEFCIILDYAVPGSTGVDAQRLAGALAMVEASYRDLFVFRDRYAPGVPIFAHNYDFPIPNGVHPICAGPWLQPSLTYTGWTDVQKGTAIVHDILVQFSAMLTQLAQAPKNNFILVGTQGTLQAADWANELHPYPPGFRKLAQVYVAALGKKFPGQI